MAQRTTAQEQFKTLVEDARLMFASTSIKSSDKTFVGKR